jgi:hypothetical protein
MTATITMPATVRELIEQAVEQGMKPSDYLAALMTPPAGFVQQRDALDESKLSNMHYGPSFEGNGWKISTYWEALDGVTFYLDGFSGNAMPAAEIAAIAEAMQKVSALI